MFNIFKRKNKPTTIKVNTYRYNIQPDITAYELFHVTSKQVFNTYQKRDEWYNNLSDSCKRNIIKSEEEVEYNKRYV
jgi:hypothetical protein